MRIWSGGWQRDVRLANDANCLAVSEAADGAAAGAHVVFGVILGTGVGGGIAIDGRVVTGPNAIAGEWGHNPLPWPTDDERPGPPCYCGRFGCLETFLSGPALAADYRAAHGVECRRDPGVGGGRRRRIARRSPRWTPGPPPRTRLGDRHQPARSRRHRRGRRPVAHRAPVRRRAARAGGRGSSPIAWTRRSCPRNTATPAASGARRDSGRSTGQRVRRVPYCFSCANLAVQNACLSQAARDDARRGYRDPVRFL